MNIQITINTDNDAFADNAGEEVARILVEEAKELAWYPHFGVGFFRPLRDINGNTVGRIEASTNLAHEELADAVEELLRLADEGAYIDLAAVTATPISRRLREALEAVTT